MFLLGPRGEGEAPEFTNFMLNARAATTADIRMARFSVASPKRAGRFQLFDDALTQFNYDCVNTISEVDDTAKTEIQVMWVAPAAGSGCVALSAMVYENTNSWFADDGKLTHIICEGAPMPEKSVDECCACDEAKYNVNYNFGLIVSFRNCSNMTLFVILNIVHLRGYLVERDASSWLSICNLVDPFCGCHRRHPRQQLLILGRESYRHWWFSIDGRMGIRSCIGSWASLQRATASYVN